jgi:hypothetical protein
MLQKMYNEDLKESFKHGYHYEFVTDLHYELMLNEPIKKCTEMDSDDEDEDEEEEKQKGKKKPNIVEQKTFKKGDIKNVARFMMD